MADTYRSGPDEGEASFGTLTKITHLTGAALSLALIVGVGVWGTKLVMRDVSGIPVVKAQEGPMRMQPENPGGQAASHQGLAVNDVAGQGTAPPPPEQLTLAPKDAYLTAEDVAAARLFAAEAQKAKNAARAAAIAKPNAPEDTPEELTLAALVEEVTAGAEPLSAPAPQEAASENEAPDATESVSEAPIPEDGDEMEKAAIDATIALALSGESGVAKSLKPKRRPDGLRTASLSPLTAAEADAARELDAGSIEAGTRLVQLGAFDSEEVARAEWGKLAARFEDYLGPKTRVIQKAQSGGKTFYRLRAHGFSDLSDARRFCAALVAEGTDCIPVVAR
ncbi:Sporulation related domain-containing protein [Roseivivax halotolerans]|uniref:Sporulation related domain-containing protein n=1 Tax=Roseivivax halotolerans TaxID=93684 RepID=A0A1I5ZDE7_9RHOB|nr:SPOR domain-containing protein [Roseivivax halotolerans]SFQ54509.1 Sporulation related domain-containing protein [Roseivivax halotolerans]